MARTQAKPRQDGPDDEKVKDRPVKVIRLRNIRGNIWANRTKTAGAPSTPSPSTASGRKTTRSETTAKS